MPDLVDLLARCRQADERAWRELFEANFDFVYRVARRLGTPEDELEDLVQDVFAVVHRKLDDFRDGRFSTWLFRITANIVSDRHKRRRFRRAVLGWFHREAAAAGPLVEPVTPDARLERGEAERDVARVLERMSPRRRAVIALFELEGLNGDQIAEHLGCPVATVWSNLYYARRDFTRIAQSLGVSDFASTGEGRS